MCPRHLKFFRPKVHPVFWIPCDTVFIRSCLYPFKPSYCRPLSCPWPMRKKHIYGIKFASFLLHNCLGIECRPADLTGYLLQHNLAFISYYSLPMFPPFSSAPCRCHYLLTVQLVLRIVPYQNSAGKLLEASCQMAALFGQRSRFVSCQDWSPLIPKDERTETTKWWPMGAVLEGAVHNIICFLFFVYW